MLRLHAKLSKVLLLRLRAVRPFIQFLYFIFERKFHARTHVKITRHDWKSTLTLKLSNHMKVTEQYATLLHEIFATYLFRDFDVRISFATLKFHDFAKILYFETLQIRVFEYNNLHSIGNVI